MKGHSILAFLCFLFDLSWSDGTVIHVIDSMDDEKVTYSLSESLFSSFIENLGSARFSKIDECYCDCGGGEVYFYPSEDNGPMFMTNLDVGNPKLCLSLKNEKAIVWSMSKEQVVFIRTKIMVDSLKIKPK